jgi:hypothetical protein
MSGAHQALAFRSNTEVFTSQKLDGSSEIELGGFGGHEIDEHRLRQLAIVYVRNGAATQAGPSSRYSATFSSNVEQFGALLLENIKKSRAANWVAEQRSVRPDWLELAYSSPAELSLTQIGFIVDQISGALHDRQFATVDYQLSVALPEKMSLDAIVAVSRITYPAQAKLSNWHFFISRAKSNLASRGAEENQLAGLG